MKNIFEIFNLLKIMAFVIFAKHLIETGSYLELQNLSSETKLHSKRFRTHSIRFRNHSIKFRNHSRGSGYHSKRFRKHSRGFRIHSRDASNLEHIWSLFN